MALIAVVVATTYALPALPASAQSPSPSTTTSSSALTIVPKKTYVIEPGKSVKDKLTIRNLDTVRDLQLVLRVVDFTYTGDGGTPKLFLAEDAPQTTWSLKPFLTVPKKVTIPKGSSKTLDMSVAIPAGHGAGSYYSAIIYSTGSGEGGNVGLSASGVTLVFTQIPGKVNEDLKLKNFGAYKTETPSNPAGYMFWTSQEPQNMAYTLQNSGNVTEAPVGSITLKNEFFGKTTTIQNVNPYSSLALIGQTRTFSACIKLASQQVDFAGEKTEANRCVLPGLWPGLYTAKLDLFYGQNGNNTQEITSTAMFWYMPWWFVAVVVVLLAILAYFIWRIYRFIRYKFYGGPRPKKIKRRK